MNSIPDVMVDMEGFDTDMAILYFKSRRYIKYFKSTSEILEVTLKYDIRTYVIIAKIALLTCFAGLSV